MLAPPDIPQLISCAQKGDSEAFATLVQHFQREIYIYLANHLIDREDAHDLTQQVFLKAWLSLATLKENTCFKRWLYKIARNVTYDHFRKRKLIALSWEELPTKDVIFNVPGPEDGAERAELIKQALTKLPPKLRICLLLYAVKGFSSHEIARTVGIREASVGTYISLARQQLRSIYSHLEKEHMLE